MRRREAPAVEVDPVDSRIHWREHTLREHVAGEYVPVEGCDLCAERAKWWAGMHAQSGSRMGGAV